MFALLCFVLAILASPFKSKRRLEAENAALRHQLIVLRRKVQGRPSEDDGMRATKSSCQYSSLAPGRQRMTKQGNWVGSNSTAWTARKSMREEH